MRLRIWLANVMIVGFLGLAVIETLPVPGSAWQRARDAVDPVLDVTGLWQGTWDLFSPQVDRENHHLEIVADYGNGLTYTWRSDDWQALNCWEVFLRVREIEYFDRVRGSRNEAAWPGLADEAVRHRLPAERAGRPLESIDVIEVSRRVSPPGSAAGLVPEEARRTLYRQATPP